MSAPPLLRRLFLLATLAIGLVACTGNLPSPALVQELHILAVRAEPPETMAGTTSQLDALVADPLGGGRPIQYQWAACTPDPQVGVSSCADPGRSQILGTGTGQTLVVATNALVGLTPQDQLDGIDLFAVLSVHADATATREAEDDQAFKRVRVSTSTTPNQNPVLQTIAIGGDNAPVVPVPAGQKVSLNAWCTTGSIETYQTSSGPVQEDMRFDWLVTAGDVDDPVTFGDAPFLTAGVTGWTAQDGAPPATVWVVLRDGRGGVDWQMRQVSAP